MRPPYADFSATTPPDPRVVQMVTDLLTNGFGNSGSRTHVYGQAAKTVVGKARNSVASLVDAEPSEVIFTSSATESNNLAILGLARAADESGRKHIVSTAIEHKSVLGPLEELSKSGFEITLVNPSKDGIISTEDIISHIRRDTFLISVMAANNETGAIQPVESLADQLNDLDLYFHVDASQAAGKLVSPLKHKRIDLISIAGHKLGAPQGVGALITRRRNFKRPPLKPLMYGGGQEKGLRPGTLPTALIAGLGLACDLSLSEHADRWSNAMEIKKSLWEELQKIGAKMNGCFENTLPTVLNCSIPNLDSEAAILALKDIVAISNGSACNAQSYELSAPLLAAGLDEDRVRGALRFSWGPQTQSLPYREIAEALSSIQY